MIKAVKVKIGLYNTSINKRLKLFSKYNKKL